MNEEWTAKMQEELELARKRKAEEKEKKREERERLLHYEEEEKDWDQLPPVKKQRRIEQARENPALVYLLPYNIAMTIIGQLNFWDISSLSKVSFKLDEFLKRHNFWQDYYTANYTINISPELRQWFEARGGINWRWLCYIADAFSESYYGTMKYFDYENAKYIVLKKPLNDLDIKISFITGNNEIRFSKYDEFIRMLLYMLDIGSEISSKRWIFANVDTPLNRDDYFNGLVKLVCSLLYVGYTYVREDKTNRKIFKLKSQCIQCGNPNAALMEPTAEKRVFCNDTCQQIYRQN